MIGELEYEDMFQSKEKGLNLEIIRVISLIFYARFLIIMHHPYQFTGKQVEQSSDNRCVLSELPAYLSLNCLLNGILSYS